MNNRITKLAFGPALIGAAVVALAASAASAQEPKAEADERMAELQQRVDEARERLELSDEQFSEFKKIQEDERFPTILRHVAE